MDELKHRLAVLRIILTIRETSAAYNQFSLPWAEKHDITICSYFASDVVPSKAITVFEGNGSVPGFFRALVAALDAKVYDVIHIHSPHLGLLFLIANLFSDRRLLPSTMITVHDSYRNYKLRNRLMFAPAFAFFQRVVCCSRASYNSFPLFYRWLAAGRLRVVQNGLDVARVDRVAANFHRPSRQGSDFTIVAVSRLVDIKNPSCVLTAFQQSANRSSRLVYIGDGQLRQTLIARSKEADRNSQIEFTGLIPREEVFNHLLNADLFISTSRGEGLPVAVLEAMACGCPVLLSDIPPHREIADQADFIPLVHPDDVAGFAREIRRFRGMPATERAAVGQRCRKLVEAQFSLSTMQAAYEDLYAQVARHQPLSLLEV